MPARRSPRQTGLVVAAQLGRVPAIGYRIAVVCRYGWPAVIRNEPFTDKGNPNPNLYYLCCPYLRRELARLEDSGAIARLEERIASDREAARALAEAQSGHRAEWRQAAAAAGRPAANGPRIAAAAGDQALKCLHAHFAFYLVHRDHAAGAMIAAEIGNIWCDDDRCRRLALAAGDNLTRAGR